MMKSLKILALAGATVCILSSGAFAGPAAHVPFSKPVNVVVTIEQALFIRGGCPAGLDKVCNRNKRGKMVCRCQS